MVAIKLPIFAGMVPSVDKHLLNDQNAQHSDNVWLYSGALVGLPSKALLHTMVNPAALIAYRVPLNDADPTYLYNSLWMEFENSNTDFLAAPVSADQFRRYYWASTSLPQPMYNTLDRMKAGLPAYILGIPQPGNIGVQVVGGGSATQVSRAYLTTLVSQFGEEGPASNPVLVNGPVDATFRVTIAGIPAADMGTNRAINRVRLYRTITSAAGTATYYMVAEFNPAANQQFIHDDVMSDATLASKPILESTSWTGPPSLDGLATMPNGIMAGFKGNELYFSEAYRPHAWPVSYSLMVEHDIVGMAVVGQTLVVATKGNPYTASGVNPASITTAKLGGFEPCLSKGSILPSEEGVYYTSPNGLILVNAGYAQNLTKEFISRDQWARIVNKGSVNAGKLGGAYYAFGTGVQRAFQDGAFQADTFQFQKDNGSGDGFLLDPQNSNVGFTFISDDADITSVKNDMYSGEVLVVKAGKIYWIDQRPGFKTDPYVWRSKTFQTPDKRNFAAMKIYFYKPDNFTFPNPVNNELDQEFAPATQLGIVRIYCDGNLIACRELRVSGELLRLPSGYKGEFWEIEFEATVKIKSFQMASAVKELAGV